MKGISQLLLAGSCLVLVACEAPRRAPNLVVITVDTLRADALGIYGNRQQHTPRIDSWGAAAVVFENATSAIGTTLPSHATLFTGLNPKRHGARWNGDVLDDRITTLAEILTMAGYETAAFVAWDLMVGRGGLHQGFASRQRNLDPERRLRSGDEINSAAVPWLESRGKRPFFLWLHYFEPHSPYPLRPWSRAALADYTGPLAEGASTPMVYSLGRELPWTEAERAALRILYDGEVREADRLVGEILDTLRRQQLEQETLVVLTSDHGQSLGEHDQIGHAFLLSQPVLHVPLLIHVPGMKPRRVAERVGLVDLAPTVLTLLELPVPRDLDGRSLAGALAGDRLRSTPYFAESMAIGNRLARMRELFGNPQTLAAALQQELQQDPGAVAVFHQNLKGTWRDGGLLVHDLAADPFELQVRPADPGDPHLAGLRRLASEYHVDPEIEATRLDFTEAVRKELEALGYLQ